MLLTGLAVVSNSVVNLKTLPCPWMVRNNLQTLAQSIKAAGKAGQTFGQANETRDEEGLMIELLLLG